MTLRNRLLLMVAIPLLGMAWVSIWNTVENLLSVRDLGRLQELVSVATRAGAVVHELQKERGMSAGYLGSQGASLARELPAQRRESDKQHRELKRVLAGFDAKAHGGQLADLLAQGNELLVGLPARREAVTALSIPVREATDYYSKTIGTLLAVARQLAILGNDKDITRSAAAYRAFLETKEHASIERALLSHAFGADRFAPATMARFAGNVAAQDIWFGVFRQHATADQVKFAADRIQGPAVDAVTETREYALANHAAESLGRDAGQWFAAATGRIDLMKDVEDKLAADLVAAIQDLEDETSLLAGFYGVTTAISVFLVWWSALTMARQVEAAHAKAEKSNQLLKEAVSSIEQGFTIYDENDRLVICNEAYRRIYATSADLIVPGNTFEEIVRRGAERGQYKDALGRVDEWVKERVAQHQNADGRVIEQRLDDGRWLLIVEYRTPSGFIVGNRIDITELKKTAAALGDRNAQLDAILQLSPDGLVSFGANGLVKSANPAFIRMTGLSEAEIYGLSQQELEACLRERAEHSAQWPGLEPCFAKVGAGGTAPGQGERQLLALRSPRESVIELLGVNSDAPSVSRLLYLRDVTHETAVDRMKSEFLAHAAHELRTPMASIYGFTELLVSQEFDAETRKDLLQTIHKQTAWLIEIINELLDISRIESRRGKDFFIEAVPIAPLVGEVLAAMQIDKARWPLILDLPAALPSVMADAAKLRQMLTNVIGNAVKYSPAGGTIAIQGLRDDSGGKCFVGLTVADHGIGMSPEQAARVCERFYRADTSGNIPGTGLGMAIVKEVIELLGGRVSIASALGTGTAVTLWLPAVSTSPK